MRIKCSISILIIFGFVSGCIHSHNSGESAVSAEKRVNNPATGIYNDLACKCNGRIILGTWLGANKDTLLSIAFNEANLKQKNTLFLGQAGNQSNLTVLTVPGFYNPLCSDVFFTNVDTLSFLEIVVGSLEIESVVRGDSAILMTGLLNGTYRSKNSDEIKVKDVLINVDIGTCGF